MKLTVTLNNGEQHSVEPNNIDRLKWDLNRQKQGWPSMEEAPFIGMTFLAWSAMRRANLYTASWKDFSESDCIELDYEETDENPKPTREDPTRELL